MRTLSFGNTYRSLLVIMLSDGAREFNARTNHEILALRGAFSFSIDLSGRILPTCGVRKTWPHISAAEAAWCFLGHGHIDWMRKYTKGWDAFAEEEKCAFCIRGHMPDHPCDQCGGTGIRRMMSAAYGYRWRHAFGRDQLELAIRALKDNPSDRRIWISSWDPRADGLGAPSKSVPCPVGFTLSIVAGELHSTLMIRSSDVFLGLPYDVMRHALVMDAIAHELGVEIGMAHFTLAHPHIYDDHFQMVEDSLRDAIVEPLILLPRMNIEQIVTAPNTYVEMTRFKSSAQIWPIYNPKPLCIA